MIKNSPIFLKKDNKKYTKKRYIENYENILIFSKNVTKKNKDKLIENIKELTEFQIWGDKNDEFFFEYFCEHNIFDHLFKIMIQSTFAEVTMQIINSLSILLLNIEKPVNIYYLLSKNYINETVLWKFDFQNDEITEYYISFLKGLALKCKNNPIPFFFNEKYDTFPLLSQAIRFYNHKESMVRASVRNITLTIFKVKDENIISFITKFPFFTYYIHLSCYLKDLWVKIDQTIIEQNHIQENSKKLQDLFDEQLDVLFYFEDIYNLQVLCLNQILTNSILNYALVPLLCNFISNSNLKLSLNLSIYILYEFFHIFTDKDLLETIAIIILGPLITHNMLSLLKLPVKVPSSYSPQWNFRNFWDEYLENVNNSTLKESEDFDSDDEKKTKSDPVSLFLFKTKNSKAIPLDDLKYIYKNDIFKYETEHKKLIKDLGILTIDNLESCNELLKKTPLDFSNRIREQINNINLNLNKVMDSKNEFEINPIREIFLSFFKSKDDNLILILCNLFLSLIYNPNISKEILLFSGILPAKISNEENSYNKKCIFYIFEICFKLLCMDSPLRLTTKKSLAKLCLEIVQITENSKYDQPIYDIFNMEYLSILDLLKNFLISSHLSSILMKKIEQELRLLGENLLPQNHNLLSYQLIWNSEGSTEIKEINDGSICRHVDLFLILKYMRYQLSKYSIYKPEEIDIFNVFYISGNAFELGQEYISENINDFMPCYFPKLKKNIFLVNDKNYFLILEEYQGTYKINNFNNLKDTEFVSEDKFLKIFFKNEEKKNELAIQFPDKNSACNAKRVMDEKNEAILQIQREIFAQTLEKYKLDKFLP